MSDSMEVLGWTLIHFCWQATLIALLYRVADVVFVRSRSQIRYGLAMATLLSMLAAALVTLGYEGIQATRSSEMRRVALATPEPGGLDHPSLRSAVGTVAEMPPTTRIGDVAEYLVIAMPWLDGMWLAGVVILSVRTAGGWYVIRRLRRSGLVEVPAEVRAIFSYLVRRMRISRQVDLYISESVSGPLAMGALRSVVLLPVSAITHLSPGQLEVVLAHELSPHPSGRLLVEHSADDSGDAFLLPPCCVVDECESSPAA